MKIKTNSPSGYRSLLLRNKWFLLSFIGFFSFYFAVPKIVLSQCTPAAATICSSGDDHHYLRWWNFSWQLPLRWRGRYG